MATTASYVWSTHVSAKHTFHKPASATITLIAGVGVDGDCHAGATVQQSDQQSLNPSAPNLRQIHLIRSELLGEMASGGLAVQPGELGENITTVGLDLTSLPYGTYLYFGSDSDGAVVQITGLRQPGPKLKKSNRELYTKLKKKHGSKIGVMGVIIKGGPVKHGDAIRVAFPQGAAVLELPPV
jgi:MOSC domain-containing protein YiiM